MLQSDSLTFRKSLGALCVALLLGFLLAPLAVGATESDIPRMPDGKPDLSGTYDIATLTPMQRPAKFGDKATVTEAEAKEYADYWIEGLAKDSEGSDPNRDAPEVGGTDAALPEFAGAAGGVGGYNAFFIDLGDNMFKIDGKYRTSIIVDPPNGRRPPLTKEAMEEMRASASLFHQNTGTAWWLEKGVDPGPYDDPERRPTGERCLLGFGSTAGPPAMPVMYNNLKRIIQTEDTVVIQNEMNHDVRVVRLNSEHQPPEIRSWLGDSIGWWEGDTLVIETTNFNDMPAVGGGATRDLKVTERITRQDKDTLLYKFTIDDPNTWSAPWTGEYPWPATDQKVWEYACHEGNYSFGGILRGARMLEEEYKAQASGSSGD